MNVCRQRTLKRLPAYAKIALLLFAFPLSSAMAESRFIDGVSFDVGEGHDSTIYKLSAQKWMNLDYAFLTNHNLHPYWEFSVAHLDDRRYQNRSGQSQSITNVGITPVLRWQPDMQRGFGIEIGVGANYFSEVYDNAGERMGTRFQFGDHIGVDYKFNKSLEVSVKFQHFSNAGIKQPNPAVNFGMIKLGYFF